MNIILGFSRFNRSLTSIHIQIFVGHILSVRVPPRIPHTQHYINKGPGYERPVVHNKMVNNDNGRVTKLPYFLGDQQHSVLPTRAQKCKCFKKNCYYPHRQIIRKSHRNKTVVAAILYASAQGTSCLLTHVHAIFTCKIEAELILIVNSHIMQKREGRFCICCACCMFFFQGCKLMSDIVQCPTKFGKCQNKAKI